MGRAIRRVPKGWLHQVNAECNHTGWAGGPPHDGGPCYIPMHDTDYETASQEWVKNFDLWRAGKYPNQADYYSKYYWEYDNPPDEDKCRPTFGLTADCYQIYETVSEGTPTSPVFETLDDMVAWLISQGTSEGAARAFAKDGWVPSMVGFVPNDGSPGTFWTGIESADKPK